MQEIKVSQEEMFFTIRKWQQTNLSQKDYCRQHNIEYHIFHYWYRKFRSAQPASADNKFVQVSAVMSNTLFAEFVFDNGRRVVFHQEVSADYLKSLAG
jgi:hypothetical protein